MRITSSNSFSLHGRLVVDPGSNDSNPI